MTLNKTQHFYYDPQKGSPLGQAKSKTDSRDSLSPNCGRIAQAVVNVFQTSGTQDGTHAHFSPKKSQPRDYVTPKVGTEDSLSPNNRRTAQAEINQFQTSATQEGIHTHFNPKKSQPRDYVTPKVGAKESLSPNNRRTGQAVMNQFQTPSTQEGYPKIKAEEAFFTSPDRLVNETPERLLHQQKILLEAEVFKRNAENFRRKNHISDSIAELVKRVKFLNDSLPGTLHLASAYIDVGNARENNGELDKALECYVRALPIQERLANPPELFKFYGQMALLYESQFKITEAIDCYTKSLNILDPSSDKIELAKLRDKLANLMEAQGNQMPMVLKLRESNLEIYNTMYPNSLRLAAYYDLVASVSSGPTQEKYLRKSIEIEKNQKQNTPEIDVAREKICKMYQDRYKLKQAFDQLLNDTDPDSSEGLLSLSYLTLSGFRNSLIRMVNSIAKFERILKNKIRLDEKNFCASSFCEFVADQYAEQTEDPKNVQSAKTFYDLAISSRMNILGENSSSVIELRRKKDTLPARLASVSLARMGSVNVYDRMGSISRAKSIAAVHTMDELQQILQEDSDDPAMSALREKIKQIFEESNFKLSEVSSKLKQTNDQYQSKASLLSSLQSLYPDDSIDKLIQDLDGYSSAVMGIMFANKHKETAKTGLLTMAKQAKANNSKEELLKYVVQVMNSPSYKDISAGKHSADIHKLFDRALILCTK
jgi:tetratricopeptide (TPR) repeat protein